jgi:hypothetical protein
MELPPVVPLPVVAVHTKLTVGAALATPANANAIKLVIAATAKVRMSFSSVLRNENFLWIQRF